MAQDQFNAAQAGTLSPEDYAAQQQINRQQRFADMLMSQTQQPQGQMVSGRYVAPSFFQMLNPAVNAITGAYIGKSGDEEASKLAQKIRSQEVSDIEKYQLLNTGRPASQKEVAGPAYNGVAPSIQYPAMEANPQAANLFAASSYSPVLRAMGLKRMTEGPKWEKAEMPQPDGSVKHGWVNYNSSDVKGSFVEGGTKPAYTPLEGARFYHETGMQPPNGMPVQNAPVAPAQTMPIQNTTIQNQPVVNRPVTTNQAAPYQATSVSTNRPAMSPSATIQANKDIYVDVEKRRREYAEKAPAALATMQDTLKNIDEMIGDASVIQNAEGDKQVIYNKKSPHKGFANAVGMPEYYGAGGLAGYLPATSTTDFKNRLEQIQGKTFLQAYETLKGAGQITEAEGTKATAALNRMKLSQSEPEFIEAAREFEVNVRKGMELARQKAGMPPTQTGGWRVK